MAKANIHTASRDALVGWLRAEIADEILKLRRKGEIENAEALEQLPGGGTRPRSSSCARRSTSRPPSAPARTGARGIRSRSRRPRATAEAGTSAARAIARGARGRCGHRRAPASDGPAVAQGVAELISRFDRI